MNSLRFSFKAADLCPFRDRGNVCLHCRPNFKNVTPKLGWNVSATLGRYDLERQWLKMHSVLTNWPQISCLWKWQSCRVHTWHAPCPPEKPSPADIPIKVCRWTVCFVRRTKHCCADQPYGPCSTSIFSYLSRKTTTTPRTTQQRVS